MEQLIKYFRGKPVRKVLREALEVTISTSGATVSKDFNLDDDIVCVTGISLSSTNNTSLVNRVKVKDLRIDGQEIIRNQYAERYFHSENVPANDRMFDISHLDKEGEGIGTQSTRKLDITLVDNNAADFEEYTVRLYLETYILA